MTLSLRMRRLPAISTDGGETVNIRQVLFVPKGADVAEDGTVTATQAQWDEALSRANAFLEDWEKECGSRYSQSQEAVFAQLASQQSEDNGSKIDGGYYHAIEKGQLIAALDEWCFADGRREMESVVLKSECAADPGRYALPGHRPSALPGSDGLFAAGLLHLPLW